MTHMCEQVAYELLDRKEFADVLSTEVRSKVLHTHKSE